LKKDERLLALVTSLLDAAEPVPWLEIRDWFEDYAGCENEESALRKFERDKADLLELGVPLRYREPDEDADGGYGIDPDEYYLPRLELTPEEMALLYLAGRAAAELPEFPLRRETLFALDKLAYGQGGGAGLDPRASGLALALGPGRPGLSARLAALGEALLANKRVAMDYFTLGSGERKRRTVDPYGLYLQSGDWYLVGRCHLRDAIRVFRVDRIGWLQPNRSALKSPDFEVPADFDLADFSRQPAYRYPLHEAVDVELWVDPARGDLRRRFVGAEPSGPETIRVCATNIDALLDMLIPMRDGVEVRAPADVRQRIVGKLQAVLAVHRGTDR